MYQKTELKNGVRVVTEEIPGVRSVAVGFWVGTGSRYESDQEAGVSHLIEHLLFKGTKKRSAKEIAESIESVGGQLNAFTSKEYTCYYARVLDEHLGLALDVLSDMYFSSLFKEDDMEREKKVVTEEIRMYEDTPDEIIHDLFTQTIWQGHPLGRPVIGTRESVAGMTREGLLGYFHQHYCPSNLVLAVAGHVTHQQVLEMIKPIFERAVPGSVTNRLTAPATHSGYKGFPRELEQVQLCLGVPALPQHDDRIYTLQVLNNLLGGGASSRLFQAIREEKALVYTVYSYYTAFQDAGLFTVYAGTNPDNLTEVLELTWRELNRIAREGITEAELNKIKEQIRGSILLAAESVLHRMQRLGKQELTEHRLISPEETLQKVGLVTTDMVKELAAELFDPSRITTTVLGNVDREQLELPWADS